MFYLLMDAVLIEGTRTKDANNRTEHVHLLKVDLHQVGELALDVLDGFADSSNGESRRKVNRVIEIAASHH
jgi:hypothetical protein